MNESLSLKLYKERIQDIFDFAVLVTSSVPNLKKNINLYKNGIISRMPDTDYFEPSVIFEITDKTIESLKKTELKVDLIIELEKMKNIPFNSTEYKKKVIALIGSDNYSKFRNQLCTQSKDYVSNLANCSIGYQKKLATYLYFSTFSYFEAFIKDLFSEIVSHFHLLNVEDYITTNPISELGSNLRSQLDQPFDSRKLNKYTKKSRELSSQGYNKPELLLFSTLIKSFCDKIEDLKANDIPDFSEKVFAYKFIEDDKLQFHSIRSNRNSIGHGSRLFNPDLSDVLKANKTLKQLASKIDLHLQYYFHRLKNYNDTI